MIISALRKSDLFFIFIIIFYFLLRKDEINWDKCEISELMIDSKSSMTVFMTPVKSVADVSDNWSGWLDVVWAPEHINYVENSSKTSFFFSYRW